MIIEAQKSNLVQVDFPKDLQEIHNKEVNIAILNRFIEELADEIQILLNQNFEIQLCGEVESIAESLTKALKLLCANDLLINDISSLLHLFKEISNANSFRLLLATVNTNMCRRFHTDINDLRLLCTYSGPGTLWLPDEAVDRKALDSCGDNEALVLDESKIQQVEAGDVVILKGAIYPTEGTKAIVHRSPTIEESGEKRLLLRIDTNDFLNFNT